MSDPYVLHQPLPSLDRPVMVVMLTGWIDASSAGAAAMATVQEEWSVRPLATFDGDTFIDYRARRPTMELREGVNVRLLWADIELHVGRDSAGHDVLTLSGPEPDSQWRRFADVVSTFAVDLGVRQMIVLGAYPFAAPHTRDPRLSSSSPSADLVDSVPYLKNSVDVPAGMGAVLEHAFSDKGIPALGIWAQVPHYVSAMSYPAATLALLTGLQDVAGLHIDASVLRQETA
ncbi:MAG TPA: PAC2 family protein, partial [Ilumatobacteraceae bacterium]